MGYGPRITKGYSERGINNMGESENGLKRQIGLFGAVAILVGAVIGSGIFMTPGTVAASAKSFGPFMVAWILAGASGILCSLVDRKSTRQNSSHIRRSRMPSSA